MTKLKTITIVVKDKVGLLADISYILGKAGINIEELHADVVGDKAIISMGVKDVKKASDILKNSGFEIANPESIVIKVGKGHAERVFSMLNLEKVALKNKDILAKDEKEEVLAIAVDKPRKAVKILNEFLFENTTPV